MLQSTPLDDLSLLAREPEGATVEDGPSDGGTSSRPVMAALTVLAALAMPVVYLLYVARYAVNVPQVDDWWTIPILHQALHGHLSVGALWSQYNESRLPLSKLIFVGSAFVDRFDTRALMFLNYVVYLATYGLVLWLLRRYLARPIDPVVALVTGVIWFSLADVQNALWAFQLPWFLTLFFVVATIALLTAPTSTRSRYFGAAMMTAVLASLATFQGFSVWAVGLLLLWWKGRGRRQIGIWLLGLVVTTAVYLPGFNFNDNGTSFYALHHPVSAIRFLLVITGTVVPGGYWGALLAPPGGYGRFEFVGALVLVAAVYVLVQSFRRRRLDATPPLPAALICFALLFDGLITLGRTADLSVVLGDNRYVLPNLLLVAGILIYLGKRMGEVSWRRPPLRTAVMAPALASVGVLVFLGFQVPIATEFGITNGAITHRLETTQARLAVNLASVPRAERACALSVVIFEGLVSPGTAQRLAGTFLRDARQDQLSVFAPESYRLFRAQGLTHLPSCPGAGSGH